MEAIEAATTSYDIITSELNCAALGTIKMHGNG